MCQTVCLSQKSSSRKGIRNQGSQEQRQLLVMAVLQVDRVVEGNLLPYLEGKKQGAPHDYLFWRSGPNSAVCKGPWKLLMCGGDLVRLFNVDEDPRESKDLVSEQPGLVKEMQRAFDHWSEDKVAPRKSSQKVKTKFNGDVIEWHI